MMCADMAGRLRINFELLFIERITSPVNPECTIAMVSETEDIVIIEELAQAFNISYDYIYNEGHRKYEEKILKNMYKFRKGKLIENLADKNIILLDHGCESGLRALTAIKTLIGLSVQSISYATPMIPSDVYRSLKGLCDKIYSPNIIERFVDVDFYYSQKMKFDENEALAALEQSPFYMPLQNKEK